MCLDLERGEPVLHVTGETPDPLCCVEQYSCGELRSHILRCQEDDYVRVGE